MQSVKNKIHITRLFTGRYTEYAVPIMIRNIICWKLNTKINMKIQNLSFSIYLIIRHISLEKNNEKLKK
jgi:hypothetical protein